MTNLEKLNAGLEYSYADEELIARKSRAIEQCAAYNAIAGTDYAAQYAQLVRMLGGVGERVWIAQPFSFDCGKNIFIGNDFTGNFNLVVLDLREVVIGDHVMIGPNTLITTVGHPLSPRKRRGYCAFAKPVRIGNDVWIGGNVTILPGVTIGDNVVVGAGAVVTHDLPANSLALGVPARVIRSLENDLDGPHQ